VIESLTIKGFRGIEALEVPRCARINVVVGRNGSGKTRLLEAAFSLMFRANAEVFPSLAKLRGVPSELPASLVADYYRDAFATRGRQEASVEGHVGGVDRKVVLRSLPGELADVTAPGSVALAVFELESREGNDGVPYSHRGYVLSDGRWWIPRARPLTDGPPVVLRTPKRLSSLVWLARQWSAVEQHGARARELVLAALRAVDSDIHDLRLVALDNGVAQVRVDYRDLGLCPVELLGDGVIEAIHYLSMLVGAEGGVMLIDEFGSALDAKNLDLVISKVIAAAADFGVQLFLSTHSLEVVDALLADAPADSLLLMQMKNEGGSVSLQTLEHDEAKALRGDLGFDLRRVA
jgi:energy-coupling factor transporter ATP-binding protein EcfA2